MKKYFKNSYWYNFLTIEKEWSYFHGSEFTSWSELMNHNGALVVEIGCGKDDSILRKANDFPDKIFIGIEAHAKYLGRLAEKLMDQKLPNVCLINADGILAVKYFFKELEVESFLMNFPDPWPKEKHQTRRLFQKNFFDMLIHRLQIQGKFSIKSDVKLAIELACRDLESITNAVGTQLNQINLSESTIYDTRFEMKYRLEKRPIYLGEWVKLFHNLERKKTFVEQIGSI